MTEHSSPELAQEYWYGRPGVIKHWFHGVFEGGGAKGVAYSGALLAMEERACWFGAVAGASAGAITAALIAAGLAPREIEAMTDNALKQVRTGLWAGLRRLQTSTGYFPSTDLREWLDDLLKTQISRKTGTKPDTSVTFLELYAATHIELNVVAADLSMRCHVVFSHIETPHCAIADAVVASSSIPFGFASCLLRVEDGDHGESYHTIVDGGVWSNFPMYVFEDEAFRRYYHRVPERIDPTRVLGFLLDEGNQEELPRGGQVSFVDDVPVKNFRAKEWESSSTRRREVPSSIGGTVATALLFPFSLLGRIVEWNGGVERGRWPTPSSRLARHLVQSINGLLGGVHPILFGLLACGIVATGAWTLVVSLAEEQVRVLPTTNWADPMSFASRPGALVLAAMGAAVGVLVLFATIVGIVANWVLLRAARRILYGLVTTYVAGPGAPAWAVAEKKNIVALPIPSTVTTLSFEIAPEDREAVIASAKRKTLARLQELGIVLPNVQIAAGTITVAGMPSAAYE